MLLLRAVFRCLSRPCELLSLIYFIISWTWVIVRVMVYPCMFSVALWSDLLFVCCVSVSPNNSQYVWVWLLFCWWMLRSYVVWLAALRWIDHVWSSKELVCWACNPSSDAPSICFRLSEVIFSFKSLRAGSQVFAQSILFLCVILHTMWSDKSMQLQCILPFGMLCLSATSIMLVKMLMSYVDCGDDG